MTLTFAGTLDRRAVVAAAVGVRGLLDHYERAPWVRENLDGEANRSVRDRSHEQAEEGLDAARQALALRRHGQDALVRTLSRAQRAPAVVSAF